MTQPILSKWTNSLKNELYDLSPKEKEYLPSIPKSLEPVYEKWQELSSHTLSYLPKDMKSRLVCVLMGCALLFSLIRYLPKLFFYHIPQTPSVSQAALSSHQACFASFAKRVLNGEEGVKTELSTNPALDPLRKLIKAGEKCGKKSEAMQVIYLLFGLKPALVLEDITDSEEMVQAIRIVCPLNPSCRWKKSTDSCLFKGYYLSNESPLPPFNPRQYIRSTVFTYPQTIDAIGDCFLKQNTPYYDQFLSYLLGFGPSWEAYEKNKNKTATLPQIDQDVFTDAHYEQLGHALAGPSPSQSFSAIGREYSQSMRKLKKIKKGLTQHDLLTHNMKQLHIYFVADETVIKTPYFKASLYYHWKVALVFLDEHLLSTAWVQSQLHGLAFPRLT
ncbi:MAG: hypothetical protein HYZ47_03105 [Simkania negevensis]|nr:hypothetical protein [Simkania negevensis]